MAPKSAAAKRMEDTPQFQEAVAAGIASATDAITERILKQLTTARGNSEAVDEAGDQGFAQALAMAIANLTDQGIGFKKVSPEIVRARAEGRERMVELLIAARAEEQIPVYNLRNKVYLDEVLIDPIYIDPASKEQRQTEIEWQGAPNEAMVPVNDVAKGIHRAFMDSIGGRSTRNYEQKGLAGVTGGGLVIRSGSKAVRPITALGDKAPVITEGGLKIPHKNQGGRYVEKNILGTIAPPARQTV